MVVGGRFIHAGAHAGPAPADGMLTHTGQYRCSTRSTRGKCCCRDCAGTVSEERTSHWVEAAVVVAVAVVAVVIALARAAVAVAVAVPVAVAVALVAFAAVCTAVAAVSGGFLADAASGAGRRRRQPVLRPPKSGIPAPMWTPSAGRLLMPIIDTTPPIAGQNG